MADTERDDGRPYGPFVRILNPETVVQETTLENGMVVRMHLHFGEIDMVHFERMLNLHPVGRYTYG